MFYDLANYYITKPICSFIARKHFSSRLNRFFYNFFFFAYAFVRSGEVLLPELNGNVVASKMLPLPPINYNGVQEDDDAMDKNTWCVDFPTSTWSQFCTLWKRMVLQMYRNKVFIVEALRKQLNVVTRRCTNNRLRHYNIIRMWIRALYRPPSSRQMFLKCIFL